MQPGREAGKLRLLPALIYNPEGGVSIGAGHQANRLPMGRALLGCFIDKFHSVLALSQAVLVSLASFQP